MSKEFSPEDIEFWEFYIWNPGVVGYLDDTDLEFASKVF